MRVNNTTTLTQSHNGIENWIFSWIRSFNDSYVVGWNLEDIEYYADVFGLTIIENGNDKQKENVMSEYTKAENKIFYYTTLALSNEFATVHSSI